MTKNTINETDLKRFILAASRATYASGDKSIQKKQADASTTIEYSNGAYHLHDNFFGGEPYGGREVVFCNGQPIWMMVYYGFVHPNVSPDDVYPFLMAALSSSTEDMPYRGPSTYVQGNMRYENEIRGEVNNFSGMEKIFRDDICLYEASFRGGFVDR